MSEQISLTFLDMMLNTKAAARVSAEHREAGGGASERWRLPMFQTAALSAGDPAEVDERALDMATWLVDPASPILSGLRFVPVESSEGHLPIGTTLPVAVAKAEHGSRTVDLDPVIDSLAYGPTTRFETASAVSGILAARSGPVAMSLLEDAQRESLRQKILEQLLVGSGTSHQWTGLSSTSNVTEYMTVDQGNDVAFLDSEESHEDSGADMATSVWVLSRTLHSAASRMISEPGSGDKTLEGGRIRLTGTRAYRSGLLADGDGLLVDLSSIVVAVQMDELVIIDRITQPGDNRVFRMFFGALVETRPSHVRVLRLA